MLILLVNLERRPDRLDFMCRQLDALGLGFERVEAIDGLAQDHGPLTPDFSSVERACALSHRKAWQRFLASGEDHCLILEDDVILSPLLKPFLHGRPILPADADMVRLETQLVRTRLGLSRPSGLKGHGLHRLYSVHTGCGAYVISRPFAVRAARDLTTFDAPLDYVLFNPQWRGFYYNTAYQMRPALGIQINLFAPTRDAPVGASNLQPTRERRFGLAVPVPTKPKRSFAVKCVREVTRWGRKSGAVLGRMWTFPRRPSFWRDVPFSQEALPVALALLTPRGQAPSRGCL